MVCIEDIQGEHPLHWLVWNNDYKLLEAELSKKEVSTSKQFMIFSKHVAFTARKT